MSSLRLQSSNRLPRKVKGTTTSTAKARRRLCSGDGDGVPALPLVRYGKGREHENQNLDWKLEQNLDQRDWRRREMST